MPPITYLPIKIGFNMLAMTSVLSLPHFCSRYTVLIVVQSSLYTYEYVKKKFFSHFFNLEFYKQNILS